MLWNRFFGRTVTPQLKSKIASLSRKAESRQFSLEVLESRWNPAVTVDFTAGLLSVVGDSNANDLEITYTTVSSMNYVIVKDGGVTIYDGTPTGEDVLASEVSAVSLSGGAGDDLIDLSDVTTTNGYSAIVEESIVLDGGADNDTILGSAYLDAIHGGSGNDSLLGGLGDDQYWFADNTGADIIDDTGGDGLDAVFFAEFTTAITVDLATASAQTVASGSTITLGTGIEAVIGSMQADTLTGSSGFNLLAGFGGDDTLDGGDGDDWYYYFDDSQGSDLIVESASDDFDMLIFTEYNTGVSVDLSSTSAQSIGGSTTITLSSATGIEGILGSAFADTLIGNARDNQFGGGGGNDILYGRAGSDILEGEDGNDQLHGEQGDDSLLGSAGDDVYLFGSTGQGADIIVEAADADSADELSFASAVAAVTIDLSSTSTQSWGGGTITLSSGAGLERVIGSAYNDSITGNSRDNFLNASIGNDTIVGGAGHDILFGNIGDDSLVGGDGDDQYVYFLFPNGSDVIVEAADADNDTLTFGIADVGITIDISSTSSQSWGDGSITLSTSTSIETVIGSDSGDFITGNSRDNIFQGLGGNDTILGNAGQDIFFGNGGDDSLVGGDGDDYYILDATPNGSDVIVEVANTDGFDTITFSDTDVAATLDLSLTSAQSWGDGTITLSSGAGVEVVIGGLYNDALTGNSRNNFIFGLDGDDSISGGDGSDYLVGDNGADTIVGGNSSDRIHGEAGNDSLVGGGGSDQYYFGSEAQGTDTIVEAANTDSDWLMFNGSDAAVTLDLSSTSGQSWGDGTIYLSSSTGIENVVGGDFLTGNSRGNYLHGSYGNDTLVGGDGADRLEAYDGNDSVVGGNDDDTLYGQAGDDTLIGSGGSDTYIFEDAAQGSDSIEEAASSDADILIFAESSTAVSIDIGTTSAQSWGNGTLTLSSGTGIEHVTGSAYADNINGNSRDNLILGGDGNDTIAGMGGGDRIVGEGGADSLSGGDGNDAILGGDGADVISGDAGFDLLAGGEGADVIDGGADDDILAAGDVTTSLPSSLYLLAIEVVMQSWTAAGTYADHVLNVTGDAGGSAPLSAGYRLVKDETILDDTSADTLTGGSDDDLFFYDDGEDTLTDWVSGEVDTDIG